MYNLKQVCSMSTVVKTVKKDDSVKNALDPRKLNDSCIKMRHHKPNGGALFNQVSTRKAKYKTNHYCFCNKP